MPTSAWWIVHGITMLGLVACLVFALASARRVGARTPYGEFLLVFALGFWLLFCAFLAFRGHELITGELSLAGDLGDAFSLGGWVLITGAFYLFTLRFPRRDASTWSERALFPLAIGVPLGLVMVATFKLVLVPGVDLFTVAGLVPAMYLFTYGLAAGIVIAGLERLYHFRASTIGRLYLLLGAALVLHLGAETAWHWFTARGGKPVIVDVAYASASTLAMVAMILHHVEITRWGRAADRFQDPTLVLEQRVLRDVARQLKGLAGEYGESLVIASATRVLRARGIPFRVVGDVVEADAPEDAWREALAHARAGALASIGDGARASFRSVAHAYGDAFAFLDGGPPA